VVTARYAEWKLPVPDLALRQADLPLGAHAVPNPRGSAPGLRLRLGDALVYALPGVPGELSAMLAEHVVPELAGSVGTPSVVTRMIRVALTGESVIAGALAGVEAAGEVRVAYLARPGDVSVRFAGPAAAVATALECSRLELGTSIYSDDGRTLAEVVHDLLRGVGGAVAVAESLTGGMLAAALTDPPGASTTFRGGEVVYATAAKARLGVDEGLLAARGPVDAEVAGQLAARVRDRFGTSHGLATTGVAGPDPVGPHRPGVVFVALDSASGSRVVRLDLPPRRDLVRQLSVVHALDLLRRELLGAAPDPGNR
jgi:nicotinamide-nucleotide amidase